MKRYPLALALAAAAPVAALDRFEIQVYEAEVSDPGQLSAELHANYTARGATAPAYAGEVPPDRALRLTLEPAIGVTRWMELGGYLMTLAAPGHGYEVVGWKLRAKLVAPRRDAPRLFYGLNVEVGRVSKSVEEHGWANEFRPIVGWTDGTWLLAANPIFGYALSGPDRFRLDLEPAAKASWNTGRGLAVGAEWYAELGFLSALSVRTHYLFAVLDLAATPGRDPGPWELSLAVGGGLGSGADQRLLVKAIFGRSF